VTSQLKVLVTGANGFVGRAVVNRCVAEKFQVRAAVRRDVPAMPPEIDVVRVGDLSGAADWSKAVSGIDVVVHTAARVHVMRDVSADPLAEFRRVNVEGTMRLARQAAKAGVRRFVFISSIKVNGERTIDGRRFKADDRPAPIDPYGISKYEAETGLLELGRETGIEVVIIRSVLVYGPGVRANMLSMMRWLHRGIPLPLGAAHNKRSLVALDNLVDLIVTCIRHPAAANEIILVSDGEDLSTTALLRRTAGALGKRAVLIPAPAWMLRLTARIARKEEIAQRLCDSLQVDIDKTRRLLGWTPPVRVEDALKETARDFLQNKT
jgi:nucleoside-diphosphate-sugar epimerase